MVKLFVEGGGDNDSLKTECRRAFTRLLERAGFAGRLPRLVACGGRQKAFKQLCTALGDGSRTDLAILLVDAEGPVTQGSPWEHVAQHPDDEWSRPDGASDDCLHFMVQCMEAWLVADRRALRDFYGQGFHDNALPPATGRLEAVAKADLHRKLEQATRDTKTRGTYDKSKHSFALLAALDPKLVRQASPWAERFFATLDRLMK
ncbi:MAG TPA: DUF4276 family protein [Thermoanaerobaculia bacterium]|nr:DUF4276 family protein [Thermoanaerobaculia bacterium]